MTLIYLYLHLFSLIIHDFILKKREDIAFKLIIPLFNLYYISYNTFENRILKDITKKYKNKFNTEIKNETLLKTNND